jgi:hypothetical protein
MFSRCRSLPFLLTLVVLSFPPLAAAAGRELTPTQTRIIGTPSQPSPFRTWTRPDRSRSAEARFLEYDAITGLAHFKRPGGRMATAPLEKLCEADQRFIATALGEKPLLYTGSGISAPALVPTPGPVIRLVPTSPPDNMDAVARRVSLTALPWRLISAPSKSPTTSAPRLVDLRTVKQPGSEPIPAPRGQGTGTPLDAATPSDSDPWGRRVAFYGCRSTWHLIDDIGTGSYQRQGRWWLTALKALESPPIQPGCWYYRDDPAHNDSGRYWVFCLHRSCCGHICGHGCGHHCHHRHCHYDIAVWRFKNGRFELYDYAHKVHMLNPAHDLP